MMRTRRLCAELLESRLVPSTYYLHQGGNLQSTIDAAQPGDSILLDAGATFTGPITLDAKVIHGPNKLWITIATNNFPLSNGVRVSPSNAPSMAKILSPGFNAPAIQTEPGASNYCLRGLEILPVSSSAVVDTLVTLGDGSSLQSSANKQPSNIKIDQCFIHGWDGQNIKRGVALNNTGSADQNGVLNSYISNFKSTGQDSQAIAGWNGTGPYLIQNNYLEAAGENVIFGGAYSYIQKTPSNITIANNTFSKPLSWNPNHPSYAGTAWSVKNLLELKNADTVTIQNNTFQNNWMQSQDGHSILITPRGAQSGGSWVTVSNVTFSHNTINHVKSVFNILGSDDSSTSKQTSNITISNNLTGNDVGGTVWGDGGGQFMLLQPGLKGGTVNLQVLNNTILNAYTVLVVTGTHSRFGWKNNIQPQGTYGMIVSAPPLPGGVGPTALAAAFPNGVITNNVIVGGSASLYPPGQAGFPSSWSGVGFKNYQSDDTGDYTLASTSPYFNAGVGANIAGFATVLF
jgi:hypothetical protein